MRKANYKLHFKMYKAGVKWLVAGLSVLTLVGITGMENVASADSSTINSYQTNYPTNNDQNNNTDSISTLTSADQSDSEVGRSSSTNNLQDDQTLSTDQAETAQQNSLTDQQSSTNNPTVAAKYRLAANHNNSNQWVWYSNGGWARTDNSGNWLYNQWANINNNWYYFNGAGYAQTGWFRSNAGNWYYFDPVNAWADRGWFKSGAGNWYYFDWNNAWALTGWQYINNHWYYFDNTNAWALAGWQKINNNWYYFDPTNAWMDTGWQTINGKSYYLESSGAWNPNASQQSDGLTGTWIRHGNDDGTSYAYWWSFKKSDGSYATGWAKINGKWYYFDPSIDNMAWRGGKTIGNKNYYFKAPDDSMVIGWYQIPKDILGSGGIWIYGGQDGALYGGWHYIDGNWYYFDPQGNTMYSSVISDNLPLKINGKYYYFDQNGHLLMNRSITLDGQTYYIDNNGVVENYKQTF